MSWSFEIDWIPNSSKNRKVILRSPRSGKRFIRTRDDVVADMQAIADVARFRLPPFFDDDELAITVALDVPKQRTLVRVQSLGARPSGRTGRQKDCDNVLTTIQDALIGVVYRDDNQIRRALVERFPEGI